MCEASAYIVRNGKEELLLNSISVMTPMKDVKLFFMSLSGGPYHRCLPGGNNRIRYVHYSPCYWRGYSARSSFRGHRGADGSWLQRS